MTIVVDCDLRTEEDAERIANQMLDQMLGIGTFDNYPEAFGVKDIFKCRCGRYTDSPSHICDRCATVVGSGESEVN